MLQCGLMAAQGTWNKEKYPDAEPINETLIPEFTWQPGVSNQPVGIAKGIYPGRVVMSRYPEACKWKGRWQLEEDQWFLPENTDIDKVREMVSATICKLTGAKKDKDAWKKIFEYHNTGKGGYRPGQVVAVKVNLNNAKAREKASNMSDTAPQMILAMVEQLVKGAGVDPKDIIIYDGRRPIAAEILMRKLQRWQLSTEWKLTNLKNLWETPRRNP